MTFIFLSQLSTMYVIQFKPYDDPYTNYNEIFNELCVLAASYPVIMFIDFIDSPQVKEKAGLGIILVLAISFGVNLIIQIVTMLKDLPKAVKKIRYNRAVRGNASPSKRDLLHHL
jgi:hypothetical protein